MNWIIAGLIVVAGLGVGLAAGDRLKLRKREGLSKAQFVAFFRAEDIPEALVAAVYEYYTTVALGDRVAIAPEDDFETLRVGQDDLDDDLQRLLKKLGLELPNSALLAESPHPLRTIGDAVRWLNWVRQRQPA